MQHLVQGRQGQGFNAGKARHEPPVIRNHGSDLCLLQHDFGNPYPVRGGILLPWQIVAAVDLEPGEQALRELGGRDHLPNNPSSPFFLSTSLSLSLICPLASASTSGRMVGST